MGPLGFHTLRDILVGEDPSDIERLWKQDVRGHQPTTGGGGSRCIASRPSTTASGPSRPKPLRLRSPNCWAVAGKGSLRAYASSLFWDDPEDNYRAARKFVEAGYRAAKFGWGPFGEDPGSDVEILAAIREALGPG